MGANGREFVRREFSFARQSADYLELLNELGRRENGDAMTRLSMINPPAARDSA